MSCSRVLDRLMEYVSGELEQREMDRIREHMAGCSQCRAGLEAARRSSDALSLLGVNEPAPDLLGVVRARLDREERGSWFALRPRLAMAAALLVSVVVMAGWFAHRSSGPRTTNMVRRPAGIQLPTRHQTAPLVPVPDVKSPRPTTGESHTVMAGLGHTTTRRNGGRPRGGHHGRSRRPSPDEPMVFLAVQPRDPESYVIRTSSESENDVPLSELTVVREFDVGGHVTSVTIEDKAIAEDTTPAEPAGQGNGRITDTPAAGKSQSQNPFSGGYTNYV